MSNEEALLGRIDELEEKIRIAAISVLQLKHEVLNKRGWIITKERLGPTPSYFYQKGEKLYLEVEDALAEHD